MRRLTPQLLDQFPFPQYADSSVIQRGRAYYKQGRVIDVTLDSDQAATCLVEGDSGDYTVDISLDPRSGKLNFACDCPYADDGSFCKHMVAAGLELKDYLLEVTDEDDEDAYRSARSNFTPQPPQRSWKQKLEETIRLAPRNSPSSHSGRYVAVAILDRSYPSMYIYGSGYGRKLSYSLVPFIIKAQAWQALTQGNYQTPEAATHFLETSRQWVRQGQKMTQAANPTNCLNLDSEAVAVLNVLANELRWYAYSGFNSAAFLPMLARLDIPLFLGSLNENKIDQRLHILPAPVQLAIDIQQADGKLNLQAGYEANGQFQPLHKKADVIAHEPPWILSDNRLHQLTNAGALSLLESFPINIPATQTDWFRQQYFAKIIQVLPVRGDLVKWHDIQSDPVPRLYLQDDKDRTLRAELRFGYGEYELEASKSEETVTLKVADDSWQLNRLHRQPEREQHFYQLLSGPTHGLKRADSRHPFGTFELRARVHPFDFLLHTIPLLTQAGFEIYGEEKLKLGRINRSAPTLRVSLASGIDWFDLKTVVEFGDQQVSLQDVRKALKRGEHYIKLADGSVGQLPAEWLAKYRHLWNLAEETAEGLRVNDVHLSLLDTLLEDDPTLQFPPDLVERRERLRRFDRIEPHLLPAGFTGQLRPYQKHGFDWLHFLREYKLGGLLADDMGLGKTIQMLAYLQSLHEAGTGRGPASLLVVPKSLLANWQRESEKFTPDLRFLEYMGNLRRKDTDLFNTYDVVLTTYGTMLRDIETLSAYHFHHIILDESQAIKNPLAKSAKAARLLKADHRMVMTGTPVENNTFELWSQFAFLNPGLLGGMDYFKREFANPIEADGDEKTAGVLRKLVYPFILRRTKEQVAPELPPRTERVIYTDMDTAQKKLYAQTRERFRAELLGLIEGDGLQDARFKILEGLLRLRQIAIHPTLVDKKYKGGAPKFEILFETLETLQAENHKALVFSQFVETLKLVKHELDERQIKYVYLDGQTPNRQARVDAFQNDPSLPFFLISLKAGGVGLNLTAADYVIHLDPWWNPAVEMQASDRAHRIGQDKPVFVYKIITRDTVEEKILQLQEKKRKLVKSLISTESSFFKALTIEDVKMLFE